MKTKILQAMLNIIWGLLLCKNKNNGNNIKLNLTPNPSHLEAVDPVVQGNC